MYITFNDTTTRMIVGSLYGFDLYAVSSGGTELIHTYRSASTISTASIVGETSLCVIVGHSSTASSRTVTLVDLATDTKIAHLHCATAVLNTSVNKKRLAIILQNECILVNLKDGSIVGDAPLRSTYPPNKAGVGVLSPLVVSSDACFFAFPQVEAEKPINAGDIFLVDGMTGEQFRSFSGNNTPVEALAYSRNADYLAVGCGGGTLVRIFSNPGGRHKYTFRRGRWGCQLGGMSFSPTADLLALGSNRGTLHVFRCQNSSATERYSVVRIPLDEDATGPTAGPGVTHHSTDGRLQQAGEAIGALIARHRAAACVGGEKAAGEDQENVSATSGASNFGSYQNILSTDPNTNTVVGFGLRRATEGYGHRSALLVAVVPETYAASFEASPNSKKNKDQAEEGTGSVYEAGPLHRVVVKRWTFEQDRPVIDGDRPEVFHVGAALVQRGLNFKPSPNATGSPTDVHDSKKGTSAAAVNPRKEETNSSRNLGSLAAPMAPITELPKPATVALPDAPATKATSQEPSLKLPHGSHAAPIAPVRQLPSKPHVAASPEAFRESSLKPLEPGYVAARVGSIQNEFAGPRADTVCLPPTASLCEPKHQDPDSLHFLSEGDAELLDFKKKNSATNRAEDDFEYIEPPHEKGYEYNSAISMLSARSTLPTGEGNFETVFASMLTAVTPETHVEPKKDRNSTLTPQLEEATPPHQPLGTAVSLLSQNMMTPNGSDTEEN